MNGEVDLGFVRVRVDYDTGRVAVSVPRDVPSGNALTVTSWGTVVMSSGHRRPPPVAVSERALAGIALSAVMASRRRGLPGVVRLVQRGVRRADRQASRAQAESALAAVRRAADRRIWRVACLEESAAAVVMLAMRRLAVTWCHGVAPDPVRLHAWIELAGRPIAEPESTRFFRPLLKISPQVYVTDKDVAHE